ncbi:MAG: hypothetical protein ACO1Q7_19540 [Gemmatimonas sp.]
MNRKTLSIVAASLVVAGTLGAQQPAKPAAKKAPATAPAAAPAAHADSAHSHPAKGAKHDSAAKGGAKHDSAHAPAAKKPKGN